MSHLRLGFKQRLGHQAKSLWAQASQPTLVRRGVVTVSLFFFLIWAVLLAYQYWQLSRSPPAGRGMAYYGQALLSVVDRYEQADAAAGFLEATEQWLNVRRREIGMLPGDVKYELRDPQGRLVYRSQGLQGIRLDTLAGRETVQTIQGRENRLYLAQSVRWQLTVLEPWRTDFEFLVFNGKALLPFLLLALPFIVIPLWFSVRHGLKPLQNLAMLLSMRQDGDLSPVGFNAQHAELKPLENSLDGLLAQLRHKLQRERAFVQDAAHELRTPLAVITAQAHVMARTLDAAERVQAQVQLDAAIQRASHLSCQLLALAALDEAQAPRARRFDLAQHLRASMALLAPEAMARHIDLSLDAPDSLMATLDEAAFASIAHNLLDNALRYVSTGASVQARLQLESTLDTGKLMRFSVQDNGPGISLAEQARVFERFYRGADVQASGSGLGLAIVNQACLRLGAGISVGAGLDGRGVGFYVEWLVKDRQ